MAIQLAAPENSALRGPIVASLLGVSSVCLLAALMLCLIWRTRGHDVASLRGRVSDLETQRRGEEEQLHEIRATIAGIASASQLIRQHPDLPPAQRARFEEMLEAESQRLVRLVHAVPFDPTQAKVDLDTMIRPLVTAQEVQGREVTWQPTGDFVNGDPDRLSEALNILLDNAAKHATGAPAEINVRRDGGRVRLEVRDSGPGVARDVREQVFARGVKSASSSGQGLGLHLARRLVSESGSTLTLDDSTDGARFVIDLQPAPARRRLGDDS